MRCGYPPAIKALILKCTLKASPGRSNTGALAEVVGAKPREADVEGDGWPPIRERILAARALAANPIPAPPS